MDAIASLSAKDTKIRLRGVNDLKEHLEKGWSQSLHNQWHEIVEALVPCVKDNNPKVCLGALHCVKLIVTLVGDTTKSSFSVLLPPLVERLGDNKLPVRQQSSAVLMSFMEVLSPAQVMEKATGAQVFQHRNWRVREQGLSCLTHALQQYGPELLNLSSFMPEVLNLLEDSNKDVRAMAVQCLEHAYRFLGQAFVQKLKSKRIRAGQWKQLEVSFCAIDTENGENAAADRDMGSDAVKAVTGGRKRPAGRINVSKSSQSRSHMASKSTPRIINGSTSKNTGHGSMRKDFSADCDTTAIQVSSDRQLTYELETIANVLTEKKDDWEARIKAMNRFLHLIHGGASSCSGFPKAMLKMTEVLGKQVTDLRSQVVKAATSILAKVAQHISDRFEPLAAPLLSHLLKLTYMAKEVMSSAGDRCVKAIILCTDNGFPRMITKLFDSMRSPNKVLRAHCMVYITLIFDSWSFTVLQRHVHALATTLRSTLGDAHAAVRSASRKCFWSFSHQFAEEANQLWNILDANTQRHLQEEHVRTSGFATEKLFSTSHESSPTVHPFHKSCSDHPASVISASCISRLEKDTLPAGSDQHESSGAGQSQPQAQPSHARTHVSGAARRVANIPAQLTHSQKSYSHKSGVSSMSGAQRVPFHSHQQHLSHQPASTKRAVHLSSRGGLDVNAEGVSNDGDKYKRSAGGAKRVQQPHHHGPTSFDWKRMPETISEKLKTERFVLATSITQATVSPGTHCVQSTPHVRLKDLIEQATIHHSSWSTRVEAWEEIRDAITSKRSEVGLNHFRLIRSMCEAINDPHYKVAQASLTALTALIKTHLEELLPVLFLKLADVKPHTRAMANEVLNLLRDQLLPSALLQAVGKVAEQPSSKIKLGSLEYAISLIPAAADYLHQMGPMRTLIQRAADHLSGSSGKPNNTPLQRAAVAAMVSLYKLHGHVFSAAIQSLPAMKQILIKQALQPCIPNIDSELSVSLTSTANRAHHRPSKSRSGIVADNHSDILLEQLQQRQGDNPQERPASNVQNAMGSQQDSDQTGAGYKSITDADCASFGLQVGPELYMTQQDQENLNGNINIPGQSQIHNSKSDGQIAKPTSRSPKSITPSDRQPTLQSLLSQLSRDNSIETKKAALQQIYFASRESSPGAWNQYLGQVLLLVMESLNEPATALLGLQVISQMLCSQADGFSDFLEIVVTRLLECYKKNSREISHTAEKTLEQLVNMLDPHRCLQVLQPIVLVEDGQVLQISIRLLSKVLPKLSSAVLLERLPHITPGLYEAFKNPSADVRKAVVFTLVELYMTLGDHFTPYLEQLNKAQLKLVTIYINRTKKARENSGAIVTVS